MDLNEVVVFIKVAQLGSFTQAAKELGMPVSTVSGKVSSLEQSLGVTLIQRTTRKLNITPQGKAFYERCQVGLEQFKAAQSELAAAQNEPQGKLRLSAPIELGKSILPILMNDFHAQYPKVTYEVILSERRVDFLNEDIDVAVRAGSLKDSSMIAKKIGSIYFAPFASPEFIKKNGKPKHPKEINKFPCLQYTTFGTESWHFTNGKESFDLPLSGDFLINDTAMVKSLAMMGNGIAMLPTFYTYDEYKSGQLVRLCPGWKSKSTVIHLVYPSQRYVTTKLRAFLEVAGESLKPVFEQFEF